MNSATYIQLPHQEPCLTAFPRRMLKAVQHVTRMELPFMEETVEISAPKMNTVTVTFAHQYSILHSIHMFIQLYVSGVVYTNSILHIVVVLVRSKFKVFPESRTSPKIDHVSLYLIMPLKFIINFLGYFVKQTNKYWLLPFIV